MSADDKVTVNHVERKVDAVLVSVTWSGTEWDDLPRSTREVVRRQMDAICDIMNEYT